MLTSHRIQPIIILILANIISIMKNVIKNFFKGLPIILLLIFNHSVSAQVIPETDAEKQAANLVKAYQAELGMTVEQASAVYKKITEILVRENEIKTGAASPDEKKNSLIDLSKEETEYMGTILDPKQWKEYKKMKKTLQPI
jgi:hypothetical protein